MTNRTHANEFDNSALSAWGVAIACLVGSFVFAAVLLTIDRGEGDLGVAFFPPTWDAQTRLKIALDAAPDARLIATGDRLPTVTLAGLGTSERQALRQAGAWFILSDDAAGRCLGAAG